MTDAAGCATLATGTGTNPQDPYRQRERHRTDRQLHAGRSGDLPLEGAVHPGGGDANNLGSTHNGSCDDTDESVVVSQVPSAITTRQFVYPQDKATVTASAGLLSGNVRFTLHDSLADCTDRIDIKYDSGNLRDCQRGVAAEQDDGQHVVPHPGRYDPLVERELHVHEPGTAQQFERVHGDHGGHVRRQRRGQPIP